MFVIAKEELFISTWTWISASVWYVSSTIVLFGVILNDDCGASKQTNAMAREETRKSDTVFWKSSINMAIRPQVLRARALSSQLYIYYNVQKSTHLQVIPQQSTQNTARLPLQTCEKSQQSFLLYNTGVAFSLRNNFADLGSFAKVSVLVHPCCNK